MTSRFDEEGAVPLSQLANDYFDATELRNVGVGPTSFSEAGLGTPPAAPSSPQRLAPVRSAARHGKLFNDPVHSAFRLDPVSVDIIDSRPFQRLRKLKQLGLTYYVFPGWVAREFGVVRGARSALGWCGLHLHQLLLECNRQEWMCILG